MGDKIKYTIDGVEAEFELPPDKKPIVTSATIKKVASESVGYIAVALFVGIAATVALVIFGASIHVIGTAIAPHDMEREKIQAAMDKFATKKMHISFSFRDPAHKKANLDFWIKEYTRVEFADMLVKASRVLDESPVDRVYLSFDGTDAFYLRGEYVHSLARISSETETYADARSREIPAHAFALDDRPIATPGAQPFNDFQAQDWFYTRLQNGHFENVKSDKKQ